MKTPYWSLLERIFVPPLLCFPMSLETDGAMAFADEFRKFILRYRGIGIKVFERFCFGEGSSITILGEGLRELGRMSDPNTQEARMHLLRRCLTHPSPISERSSRLGFEAC